MDFIFCKPEKFKKHELNLLHACKRSKKMNFNLKKNKKRKEHDPNPWFSGITFFSGLALCSFQIKKRSLMGCLFFDADFSTFFHFGR